MTPIEQLRQMASKAFAAREVHTLAMAKGLPGETGWALTVLVQADNDLDIAMRNHLPALLAVVEAAQAVMDEHPAGYYYHGHKVPGIWDPDNGELAGKACENCAKVFRLRAALATLTTQPKA